MLRQDTIWLGQLVDAQGAEPADPDAAREEAGAEAWDEDPDKDPDEDPDTEDADVCVESAAGLDNDVSLL